MFKTKRTLSLIVAVCLCFSSFVCCVSAEELPQYATREYIISEFVQSIGRSNLGKSEAILDIFSDSDKISDEYREDISRAIVGGILKGYDDRTIRPTETVTRIEAMVMLARSIPNLEQTGEAIDFTDVPGWAKKEIDYLSGAGLVNGYGDGTMGADDFITVEQVGLLTKRSDEALRTVDVGESFYGYINEKKFRNVITESTTDIDVIHGTVVTKDNAWSQAAELSSSIQKNEKEIITKIVNGDIEIAKGSPEQRVRDMLECIVSDEALNDEDIKNIKSMRKAILDVKSIEEYLSVTADIYKLAGINVGFELDIGRDNETGVPYPAITYAPVGTGGILAFRTVTDTTVYKNFYADLIADYLKAIDAEFNRSDIKTAVELQIASSKAKDYSSIIDSFLAISVSNGLMTAEEAEKEHWDMVKKNPDLFDPETGKPLGIDGIYESKTKDDADAAFSGFDLCKELERYGFTNLEKIIIPKKEIVSHQKGIISEKNLNALKINAILRLDETLNIALGSEERVAHERLGILPLVVCVSKDINGVKEGIMSINEESNLLTLVGSSDKDPLSTVNLKRLVNLLPNDIGLIYTNHCYDDEISYKIIEMVHDIGLAYVERFKANTWMDESTKKKAIEKVENMLAIIGYPDNYTFPDITPISEGGSLFSNTLSVNRHNLTELIRANEDKEYIRTRMYLAPDTVNAGYIWMLNSMNIPAGILNPPFYDENASYESNLGAIGMIIAHEIGHAFDAEGAMYDKNGCLNNWWTEGDKKEFEAIKEKFIEYYSRFEVVDGVVQDSRITIGENMADFAAMQIIMDIIGDDKEKQKECFESYANMWASLGSVSYITRDVAMKDAHSRNVVRVNAIVASFDQFYEIYDIKEGDPMYVAPEDRLKLW